MSWQRSTQRSQHARQRSFRNLMLQQQQQQQQQRVLAQQWRSRL
jgi:hypothetical protein